MSVERLENRWHGIVAKPSRRSAAGLVVRIVERDSPAEKAGMQAGRRDQARRQQARLRGALDFERRCSGAARTTELELTVDRDDEPRS